LPSAVRYVGSYPRTFDQVLAVFETGVTSLDRTLDIASQPDAVSKVLASYTFIVHAISQALHAEVIDRAGIDKRWGQNRTSFLEKHAVRTQRGTWPCDY
jgi:hypothetical protein